MREKLKDKPEDKVEIVHAVYPRLDRDPRSMFAADFPYACVYLETASRRLLEESGYHEMPYMAPRWSKAAGEIYGRGPGLTALSDTRVLNAMSRTALMAAEKMSDPPLMVPDDGFLGPVRTGPGGLSYYRAGSQDRIEALPVKVDLKAAEEMMEKRRQSVRRIFLNDQLTPDSGPAMTATEAVIRQSEKMRVLGPVLGRMQTEFLGPLIGRVFRILLRAGELPRLPEGLAPDMVAVEYVSPVSPGPAPVRGPRPDPGHGVPVALCGQPGSLRGAGQLRHRPHRPPRGRTLRRARGLSALPGRGGGAAQRPGQGNGGGVMQRDHDKAVDMHQAYCRVFDGVDGRKVLEDLKARGFFLASCLAPDPCRTAFNEGRRSLVLHVLAMLDRDRFGDGSATKERG